MEAVQAPDIILGTHLNTCINKVELTPTEYPYERNPEFTACIPIGKGNHYYTGAFNGGKTDSFLKLCFAINEATNRDFENDIIAV
ncbi:MAG: hypothetical protein IJE66_05390 [Akkermansia sp.]|nr:hypothetical protein [Akkermansia sp.]